MIIYSLYKVVNTFNGKVYIGFTKNFTKRLNEHKQDFKRFDTKFYKAIKKYGMDNFSNEILYQSLNENHIKEMEIYFISEYNSYRIGYNSTPGGDGGGRTITQKTKNKMSLSKKGKFQAKDKNNNYYLITKNDPRYISGELVGINKGRKFSDDTKKILSSQRIGNQNLLGHKHSIETKNKISNSLKKHYENKKGL